MNLLRRGLLCLLVVLTFGTARAQQGSEPITVTDLLQIRQLGALTAAPDGRTLAYTVRSIEPEADAEGAYTYRSHLYVLPVSGSGTPQQMTHGDREASQPAWHPDSDRLAFVREVDGKPQVFVMPLYGGEAYQLTAFAHGASEPLWSPDGQRLLFAATLTEKEIREQAGAPPAWSDERPGRIRGDDAGAEANPDGSLAELRAWLRTNNDEENPRVFNRLNLQGELDLAPTLRFRHYFVVDAKQPRAEPVPITQGYRSFSDAAWLPDGFQILLSAPPDSDEHPDRVRDRDLFLVDFDGRNLHRLLDLEGYALSNPVVSPDGQRIVFQARDLNDPGYAQAELGLFALGGGTPPELVTLGFDRSLYAPRWSADNWYIYFAAPSDGGFPLYRLAVDESRPALPTGRPATVTDSLRVTRDAFARNEAVVRDLSVERLTNPNYGIRSFDVTAATAYFILTEPLNPFELYATTMEFENQRRLTEHNAAWLRTKRLSEPEAATLRRDTLSIPYWVMKPAFYQRGRSYPVVVEIHGGPAGMWGPGEASMWHEFQLLAAKGYGVVFSNPRGAGGYGYAYQRANYRDWGDGPAGDVLAIATEAVRRNRWIDEDRQVVTGGSYAGYLTAWIVGHDNRFKAAVAQRGVYDLDTFFGEGNAWRLVPSHFGGYPWEADAAEALAYNSPLTYVEAIRTPLLIMHGDNDLRTGVIQSEVLYKSLKVLGRPVEYVRYPKAGHNLSRSGDPKQRMDRLLRIYEFMERYVGPTPAPTASQ